MQWHYVYVLRASRAFMLLVLLFFEIMKFLESEKK